jgi:hypothetical protein
MTTTRVLIPPPAERRIRREARSATLRERAWALRRAGWTLSNIGQALGVSPTRAFQMVRKAERLHLINRPNEEGALAQGAPSFDSVGPLAASRNISEQTCVYPPPPT